MKGTFGLFCVEDKLYLQNDYIQRIFHMIDRQGRGDILWQDFYLVVAILISLKDRNEKQFIFRHSKIVFDLMDEDGGGTISADEFKVCISECFIIYES